MLNNAGSILPRMECHTVWQLLIKTMPCGSFCVLLLRQTKNTAKSLKDVFLILQQFIAWHNTISQNTNNIDKNSKVIKQILVNKYI